MKTMKVFSALTALTVGTFAASSLVFVPSVALADHHESAGEKSCSGEKGCGGKDAKGEKSCSGEKGCSGKDDHHEGGH
jgi:hypothetical protein